mmetsp:Transcript_38949/g.76565  ORF Transcript_38949/g.76565 Transcript_38949/m.76565 type:complete len:116 (+) Transcript_38949:877-1224(+)
MSGRSSGKSFFRFILRNQDILSLLPFFCFREWSVPLSVLSETSSFLLHAVFYRVCTTKHESDPCHRVNQVRMPMQQCMGVRVSVSVMNMELIYEGAVGGTKVTSSGRQISTCATA